MAAQELGVVSESTGVRASSKVEMLPKLIHMV